MEQAHTFVSPYTRQSIQRQKKYNNHKLSFESFEEFKPNDKVYVYFLANRPGCAAKFTTFWRGPFNLLAKVSEVLYKVYCGRSNSGQIILVDRLRKAKEQILQRDEITFEPPESEITDTNCEMDTDILPETVDSDPENRLTRHKANKPKWMQDYILYTCRLKMAKTKTTKRKCMENAEKSYACFCGVRFIKRVYLNAHIQKFYSGPKTSTESKANGVNNSFWTINFIRGDSKHANNS